MSTSQNPPRYQQVKGYVRQRIDSGAWPEDFRVPSENQLVRELGISRMTINRALRELSDEGRIKRVQGVGTFVAGGKPESTLLEIRNIADEIRERGHHHHGRVHLLCREKASVNVAQALELEPGDEVFHSIMIHHENATPVQLEDRYVNPAVAPDYLEIDFTRITPNEYLMQAAPLLEVEHILEAIQPGRDAQELLNIPPGEPCLLLHRRTWSGGQVASRAWLTHPGSRYQLGARFASDSINKPPTQR